MGPRARIKSMKIAGLIGLITVLLIVSDTSTAGDAREFPKRVVKIEPTVTPTATRKLFGKELAVRLPDIVWKR